MKNFLKILILFFLFACLFFLLDSFTLNRISRFAMKGDTNTSIEEKVSRKIDIPGALRVVNSLANKNKNISLDKEKIILITNKYREENGNLSPLTENKKLDSSAEEKLKDMFDKQYFEHISPSGKSVSDLADNVGYEYILIGENLALGDFNDEKDVVSAWMNSSGHRANILNRHYSEIGVAVGYGLFNGQRVWIAIQHFATPKTVCPNVDQNLYNEIINEQEQISKLESSLIPKKKMITMGIFDRGSSSIEQIKNYNSSVIFYNNLIKESKEEIKKYNSQVSAFNNCVSLYQ